MPELVSTVAGTLDMQSKRPSQTASLKGTRLFLRTQYDLIHIVDRPDGLMDAEIIEGPGNSCGHRSNNETGREDIDCPCLFRQTSAEVFYLSQERRKASPKPLSFSSAKTRAVAVRVRSVSLKVINAQSMRCIISPIGEPSGVILGSTPPAFLHSLIVALMTLWGKRFLRDGMLLLI